MKDIDIARRILELNPLNHHVIEIVDDGTGWIKEDEHFLMVKNKPIEEVIKWIEESNAELLDFQISPLLNKLIMKVEERFVWSIKDEPGLGTIQAEDWMEDYSSKMGG